MRSNEKERLRFSESVMAVIFRLDAIEGSIPEVRNQRKEATKLAIQLQDAMDAITSEQEEELHSKSADRDPPDIDSESKQCFEATAFQEITHSVEGSGSRDVVQGEPVEVTTDVHDDPIKAVENGGLQQFHPQERCAAQDEAMDAMDCLGNDLSCREVDLLDGIHAIESIGVQPAVGSSNGLCVDVNKETHEDATCAMLNEGLCEEANKDTQGGTTCVMVNEDNADITKFISATGGEVYEHTDVCEEDVKGLGRGASLNTDTPRAEDQLDGANVNADDCFPMVEEVLNPQGPTDIGQSQNETLMEVNTSCEGSLQGLDAVPRDKGLTSSDSVLLQKLSKECGQLRLMLGKLLAQSKAQTKVICALGDRLEILEHQQLSLQNDQERGKRKLKKGSKRCVKCRHND